MPSVLQAFSLSLLRFSNGSTAIDFSRMWDWASWSQPKRSNLPRCWRFSDTSRQSEIEQRTSDHRQHHRDRDNFVSRFDAGILLVRCNFFAFGSIPSGSAQTPRREPRATGNPIISNSTTRRTAQFGISKKGKTCVAIWMSNHATTA